MTRFDVARTQQPKSTAAYGSLRFGPLRYQLKRTIGMLPTPDNSECSRHISAKHSQLKRSDSALLVKFDAKRGARPFIQQ
ncbi:hypothetical protein [Tateyamaria sp.]|uniref:hypothetical protein n=1 Tax=Tateyamaria sp. TaxID=1929288 RepID=UPI003B2239A8